MLKEILSELKDGRSLVLSTITNQRGRDVVLSELEFDRGRWLLTELNCMSAWDLDLGTCSCNSHQTWWTEEIDRQTALRLIRDYISRVEEDEARRKEEIEFLDRMIESA